MVITMSNQNKEKRHSSPIGTQKRVKIKLSEARENACDQVVIGESLYLIGWEGGVNFLNQSQSTLKRNQ